jgi:succinate dehydrogenase/fumarate reductase flavoprotein subunit
MAAVPHNYMLGAFTYGWFAGQNAADFVAGREFSTLDAAQIETRNAGLRAAGS